ncbi:LOW QUALITY PROTEIN: uncharacterized protein FYW47_012130 [Aplochiton taeniatus]
MPQPCAAFGCSNRRNITNWHRGITFHKAWAVAVCWKDFEPTNVAVLCSHFRATDFDRTGQIGPNIARSTRSSNQSGEASEDPVPVSKSPEPPSTSDHHYALNPDEVKSKIVLAQGKVEERQKQKRNARDRQRRQQRTVKSLLEDLNANGKLINSYHFSYYVSYLTLANHLTQICDSCHGKLTFCQIDGQRCLSETVKQRFQALHMLGPDISTYHHIIQVCCAAFQARKDSVLESLKGTESIL